ncbi:MAG: hypothetical protein K2Y23_25260 [Cyanobacteria bacterium]|nr:hypothetical protein [Cyanobacteriota bacterium]
MSSQQLSPGTAIVIGALMIVIGSFPVLIGAGVIDAGPTDGTPGWVLIATGLMFVCGGFAMIAGYAAAGGAALDGDLPPDAGIGLRAVQFFLGVCITGSLLAILSWIAFGEGERRFSATLWWPFGRHSIATNERQGRIVFGIAALGIGAFLIALICVSVRRLRRAIRGRRA